MRPPVLILSYLELSGKHGLAADLRAAEALGANPLPVLTAVSLGPASAPQRLHPVPGHALGRMLDAALECAPVAAMVGVLTRARHVRLVARRLHACGPSTIVLAPLSVAFDARPLVGRWALTTVRRRLLTEATAVVLPARQASGLVPGADDSLPNMKMAGQRLLDLGARAAWLRAGSHEGRSIEVFVDQHGPGLLDYPPPSPESEPNAAPTALATLLACGSNLRDSIDKAHRHVYDLDRSAHRILK
ncbi:MAG: bifunctional hydroxymethylpyrimidine kinase/phosphomethylpyrimidine kinase [Acidobacteriota bacterium]